MPPMIGRWIAFGTAAKERSMPLRAGASLEAAVQLAARGAGICAC